MQIIHIAGQENWIYQKDKKTYCTDSLDLVGYIHCCTIDQIEFVLSNWFDSTQNLVFIYIDSEKILSPIRFENAEEGRDLFPHIYGPINKGAIVKVVFADQDKGEKK